MVVRNWDVAPSFDDRSDVGSCVKFSCDFDSGNLGSVRAVAPWTFKLQTLPDCAGTLHETHSRTWFHFRISNVPQGQKVQFFLRNLNNQKTLFDQGLKPVFKCGNNGSWNRIPGAVHVQDSSKQHCNVTFGHKFLVEQSESVYFAFCYPYSYEELQEKLAGLERRFGVVNRKDRKSFKNNNKVERVASSSFSRQNSTLQGPEQDSNEADESRDESATSTGRLEKDISRPSKAKSTCASNIYFHRELLTHSVKGRRIDVLTITSAPSRKTAQKLSSESDSMKTFLRQNPVLFPQRAKGLASNGNSDSRDRNNGASLCFPKKQIIFVSARVHPGETPASFSFDGYLDFLLDEEDPRAQRLRELFVFKMVPMLNPDGVALGHYRANALGINLNRFYHSPEPASHPSIAAVSALLTFYAIFAQWTKLYIYLDMHAHASKRGCFLFGNYVEDVNEQVRNVAYSNLVALNTPYLDLGGCDFSKKNMAAKDKKDVSVSKEGSGRVGIFKSTGVVRCYTLECNYNSGKVLNSVPQATLAAIGGAINKDERGRKKRLESALIFKDTKAKSVRYPSPERNLNSIAESPQSVKYDPGVWRDVGKACAVAVLDLVQENPWSRIQRSHYKSLDGVQMHVQHTIRTKRAKQKQKATARRAKRSAANRREQQAALQFPIIF